MVALEATFVPSAASTLLASYEVRLDDASFAVRVEHGTISIARGVPRTADAQITADSASLRGVVFGDRKLADTSITLSGDKRLAQKFFRLFARP